MDNVGKTLWAVEIAVTNRCNLSCHHCSAAPTRGCMSDEPTLGEIQRVLREARALGATRLDITGGEPTLRPDLPDIIHEAKQQSYLVKVLSNGVRLDARAISRLRLAGLDALAVSLDGSTS